MENMLADAISNHEKVLRMETSSDWEQQSRKRDGMWVSVQLLKTYFM